MDDGRKGPHHDAARTRVLTAIRETRSLDAERIARVFRDRGRPLLPGFLAVLNLQEHDPRSAERLAALIGEFDAEIHARLATLAQELPDHRYYTMHDVIAGRGYRSVRTTALGAGALMMWGSVQGGEGGRHWRHGIATGVLASLAVWEDSSLYDRAVPAGLLHDLGRLCLPVAERSRWTNPALAADTAGRLVGARLGVPDWLPDALFSCELGPRGDGKLEAAVAVACATAGELGYESAASVPLRVPRAAMVELRRALDRAGGPEWLASRVEASHLAAQGHSLAAFADR